MSFKLKLILTLSVFFAGITSGYVINDWKRDSNELEIKKKLDEFFKEQQDKQLDAAIRLEEKLKELKANERIIHTKEREVIERPVYRNVCIDDDGLSILNQYGSGKPNKTSELAR